MHDIFVRTDGQDIYRALKKFDITVKMFKHVVDALNKTSRAGIHCIHKLYILVNL